MKIETFPNMDFNWMFNGALQRWFYRERKSYMFDKNLCAKRCVSKNYFFTKL